LNYPVLQVWGIALTTAGILLLVLAIGRNKWIGRPSVTRTFRIAELLILLSLALFSAQNRWLPPAIMFGILSAAVIFALFWERGTGQMMILVNEAGLKMPVGRTKRNIPWIEIDQVLLKFGTLTVNCADNRLYQWSIDIVNFDATDFQVFCTRHIEENKTKRGLNDW
jgi:hypothetical protein